MFTFSYNDSGYSWVNQFKKKMLMEYPILIILSHFLLTNHFLTLLDQNLDIHDE